MTEQVLRTLMRTTDLLLAGFFSPAAVAAVGVADIYARLPARIGRGIGDGAIALSSQDTGSGAAVNRDQTVTQALVLGILIGVPFVVLGLFFARPAIALLGAKPAVARMGGAYLAIIFVTNPARQIAIVGARCLQGTGDTETPMYVNMVSNGLNIVISVVLALGIGPAPRLEVIGVGIATAFGNTFTAVALLVAIRSPRTLPGFARPENLTIARQIMAVSAPRIAEGLITVVVDFPFNAVLLAFGTEVNAAYQIGRRMYQQVIAPLSRGYSVAASIVVGQLLGDERAAEAYFGGWAAAALGLATVGTLGIVLFVGADEFVYVFTRNAETVSYATAFARAYAVAAPFAVVYTTLKGSLRGGSDTVTPFIAKMSGMFVFLLGISYIFGIRLEYGVLACYVAIVLDYLWRVALVGTGFYRREWIADTFGMMEERGSVGSDED